MDTDALGGMYVKVIAPVHAPLTILSSSLPSPSQMWTPPCPRPCTTSATSWSPHVRSMCSGPNDQTRKPRKTLTTYLYVHNIYRGQTRKPPNRYIAGPSCARRAQIPQLSHKECIKLPPPWCALPRPCGCSLGLCACLDSGGLCMRAVSRAAPRKCGSSPRAT